MPGLVEVAPLPPVPLHDLLTYEVPLALRDGVQPGVRVRIPLGRQVRTGVVTAFAAEPPVYDTRPILEVLDADPFLTPEMLDLARWAARYYLTPLADVLAVVVPTHLPAAPHERVARLGRRLDAAELAALERRAPAQARAYHALVAAGGELATADAPSAGVRPAAMRALVASGLVEVVARERATVATQEAPVHRNVKQAILAASELDTRLIMRSLRNTERVLRNAAVDRVLTRERELGSKLTFADIASEVAGVYPRIMQQGEMDAGAWS